MKMINLQDRPAAAGSRVQSGAQTNSPARPTSHALHFALVVGAAFVLYWASSFALELRKGTTHFGADTWHYTELAHGNVLSRLATNPYLDRITRFHPATVFAATAWLQLLSPLSRWIPPLYLLKAMFAAVGAVGVWAAMSAFATVASHRGAILFGIIYGTSLGVWYFASLEESKIVTASLSALYIATYLQVRKTWTARGIVLLTTILLVACLNEVVSGFLVFIPLVDALVRHGWNWRRGRWIAVHALAGPAALLVMEGVSYWRLGGMPNPEGTSHFSMLYYYVVRNDYSLGGLYSFAVNWLFFNIAAPSLDARYAIPASAFYGGHFAPSLSSYFTSAAPAGAAILLCVVLAASAVGRRRGSLSEDWNGILLGLTAYTLVRGAFFFLYNSYEPLLASPAVTLAHMLIVGVPLAASRIPAKSVLLGAFAAVLFAANGAFIVFGR